MVLQYVIKRVQMGNTVTPPAINACYVLPNASLASTHLQLASLVVSLLLDQTFFSMGLNVC